MLKDFLHVVLCNAMVFKISIATASFSGSTPPPILPKPRPKIEELDPFAKTGSKSLVKADANSWLKEKTVKYGDAEVAVDDVFDGLKVHSRAAAGSHELSVEISTQGAPLSKENFEVGGTANAIYNDFVIFKGGEGFANGVARIDFSGKMTGGNFDGDYSYWMNIHMDSVGEGDVYFSNIFDYSEGATPGFSHQRVIKNNSFEKDFGFTFGIPYQLTTTLSSNAHAGAAVDLRVSLPSFKLPEGVTVISASGKNYNIAAVPEPSQVLMLLIGLMIVGTYLYKYKS